MTHKTTRSQSQMEIPAAVLNWATPEEIVDNMRRLPHPMLVDVNGRPAPKPGSPLEYLSKVFETYADPDDWRNPFLAVEPLDPEHWVAAAIVWFHGAVPMVRRVSDLAEDVIIASPGYQCW